MGLLSSSRRKYLELLTTDLDAPRPPLSRGSRRRSFLLVLVSLAILVGAGYWSLGRIIHGSIDSEPKDYHSIFKKPARPSSRKRVDAGNATKALVVASYTQQDVSWLPLIPSDWKPYRYFLDDPNPPNNLSVPRNEGREAMVYLTYIIDNYDDLPDYIVFVHGHFRSWHQVEPLHAKIRGLNLSALSDEGYISLRCGDQMGCEREPFLDTQVPNWEGELKLPDFWDRIMPGVEVPRYLNYKCCGQHAVTRENVLRLSREDWIRIRSPLFEDVSEYRVNTLSGNWIVGTFYEKFWHIFLGPSSQNCPSVERCEQVFFSNAIACDRGTDLMNFEEDGPWDETVCVTAYDGLEPDEPADLDHWHKNLITTYNRIRQERTAREKEKVEQLRAYRELTTEAESIPETSEVEE